MLGERSRLSHITMDTMWSFYNHTHIDLGDITPAEKAGMFIMGPNKILTLMRNVAMSKMATLHPQWMRNVEKACQTSQMAQCDGNRSGNRSGNRNVD